MYCQITIKFSSVNCEVNSIDPKLLDIETKLIKNLIGIYIGLKIGKLYTISQEKLKKTK